MADRGDGQPFVQAEWRNEFGQLQTKEVSDHLTLLNQQRLVGILSWLKQGTEKEEF